MTSQKPAKSTNFPRVARMGSLVFLAFAFAVVVHWANHHFLAVENPAALRHGVSVVTSDDASYFRPALNFLDSGVWKGSSAGVGAYVLRSPGYGMVIGVFTAIFGEVNGLLATVLFQLILWSLAVGAIPFLAQRLGFTAKLSWWIGVFVALMPMFYGFLSYTLTEALTPSLVIFFYTFLFMGMGKKRAFLLLCAIVLAFAILVRPALILLIFSYLPFLPILKRRLIPVLIIALLPTLLWQIRVHRFTGRVDLHPIYHSDAADLFRPLHAAAWDFHKMTGQTGVEFHQSMNLLWQAAEGSISDTEATEATIEKFHVSVPQTFGREELASAYAQYIAVLRQQVPYRLANEPIEHSLIGEENLIGKFETMKKDYVSNHFVRAWLLVPARVVGDLVLHSNLSLYLFQKPLRGNVLVEALRWISLSVHLFTYLFALVFLFGKKNRWTVSLAIPAISFFLYLIFIQRGIEERYMLPYLIPLFLLAAHTCISLFPDRVKGRFLKFNKKPLP